MFKAAIIKASMHPQSLPFLKFLVAYFTNYLKYRSLHRQILKNRRCELPLAMLFFKIFFCLFYFFKTL